MVSIEVFEDREHGRRDAQVCQHKEVNAAHHDNEVEGVEVGNNCEKINNSQNYDAAPRLQVVPEGLQELETALYLGHHARTRSALQKLAMNGENVEVLLSTGDQEGQTLFHMFAALPPTDTGLVSKRSEAARLLVEARAHIASGNLLGETPLLLATRAAADVFEEDSDDNETRLTIVHTLLVMRADPNVGDNMDETPLMEAACVGDFDLCKLLLDATADANMVSRMGLIAADFTDSFPLVRELLTSSSTMPNVDMELQSPLALAEEVGSQQGQATYADNCRTVQALNELQAALSSSGAIVEEAAGQRIDSAVSWLQAIIEADLKAADVFRADTMANACGAALQARNAGGQLLLQLCQALSTASLAAEAVLWLIAAGAQPNVKNAFGEPALVLAVRAANAKRHTPLGSTSVQVASALLQAQADPNLGNAQGATPLMEAVCHGHKELCCLLFSAGAEALVAKEYMI